LKDQLFKSIENADFKTFDSLLKSAKIPDSLAVELFEKIQGTDFETMQKEDGLLRSTLYSSLFENVTEPSKLKIIDGLCSELSKLGFDVIAHYEKITRLNAHIQEKIENDDQDMLTACQMQQKQESWDYKYKFKRLTQTLCALNSLTRFDERLTEEQAKMKRDANQFIQ
jgi:hypothetical protein